MTTILLHGFTQTGRSWGPLRAYLQGPALGPVVAPDLPGHGRWSGVRTDLWETAGMLSRWGRGGWAGYSMGGRVALHLALGFPEAVERLALISATAGLERAIDRVERQRSDESLARRVEEEGTEAFVRWWVSQPLFATLALGRAGLAQRQVNTPEGLASSLRLCGAGRQEPLWERLGELGQRKLPVLAIAGAQDTRYRSLAERMAYEVGPSASTFIVPGTGHACHLERPDLVGRALAEFFED